MENRVYYIFFFLLTALLSGCIEDTDFSKDLRGGGKPVFRDGVTFLGKTASSIEFSAEILKENGYEITERGFVWSTTLYNPTLENGKKIMDTGMGIGVYTYKLEGLSGSTMYYIRPYAINEQGTEYGSELAITTNIGLGKVTTSKPKEVYAASAIVEGMIDDAGEGEIIRRGVYYYSETESYMTKDSVMSDDETDIYQCQLTNLSLSSKYYYIAFVTNTFGTFEGTIDSLKTKDLLVEIGETTIKNKDYNEVLLSSIVSNSKDTTVHIIERGFCWGPDSIRLTIAEDTVQAGAGSGYFEREIKNLTSQKLYYARAYAKTLYGIVYSERIEFAPKDVLPTVRTEDIENLQNGKVDFSCTVMDKGKGDIIISAGMCWSLTNTTPTTSDNRQPLVLGLLGNKYSGQLTKLKGGTTYYIRAYATNSEGTSFGETKQFTTPPIFTTGLATFRGDFLLEKSNAYFAIGDNFYIMGGDKGADYSNELWVYSITDNEWKPRKSLASGTAKWQSGVTYGMGAFVFGGLDEDGNAKNSFSYYNMSTNLWEDHPNGVEAFHSAVGFASGNSVYFVGGKSGNTVKKTVWSYDKAGNIWTRKVDFPDAQSGGIAVVLNGVVYVGMGKDSSDVCRGILYTTEDGANTWQNKAFNPLIVGGILGGVAYGESIYVIDEYFNIHEFNTHTNAWLPQKTRIPAAYQTFNCIFENNGRIYMGLGSTNSLVIYNPAWDN